MTDARRKPDERASQVRKLVETLDLLYDRFLAVRPSAYRAGERERVRRRLTRVDQKAAQRRRGGAAAKPPG
ncbi:hypothetical protein J0H58_33310 [bacterium]|nr:hypothetical protein [bacterium]